ncbi:alpha/beta hydrolase [Streptomyces sp. E11-3]|uniref:alpha/beta fold hydrolase n=1 Tax=Streptomyces sp. E11-3 TaxID=3110112 RepID=UPI00397F7968
MNRTVVEGNGPVCVLSGGLGLAWFDWDAVARLLTPHRTVIRLDRLGPEPHRTPSLAREAARILRAIDAHAPHRQATIVGHSLAGFHCEAFARLYPSRTAGLVLVDSSVEEDARRPPAPALRTTAARLAAATLRAIGAPRALGPPLRRAVVRAGRTAGGDPAPYDLVRRTYGTSNSARAILTEYASYHDQAAELAALRREFPLPPHSPVTVLAAGDNRRWLERQAHLATELHAHFRVVEPSGHLVMLDRPTEVADAVLSTISP